LKPAHLILIIPFLLYLCAAIILQPGALISLYPDSDLTSYLAANSISKDHDLVYTREDSDRYLRQYDQRPFPFRVVNKQIIDGHGGYQHYYAFYSPEVFVFFLVPFVALFGFRGWLLLHALLILAIYWIGWMYYRGKDEDAISPAVNSVIFFTLIPLPVLFLLPSHHLFLMGMICAAVFSGLRGHFVWSAIFSAIAFSSQPFAALFCVFLIAYWQTTRASVNIGKFVIAAALSFFVIWGLETLMYPARNISEPRWITTGNHLPLAQIWNTLPDARNYYWSSPDLQRLIDFLFGRNSGFLIYGFVSGALLLSTLWLWRDSLVRVIWLFVILYSTVVCFSNTSGWSNQSFVNDLWIILSPLPYFAAPFIRPKSLFISIVIPAAILVGPLLVNPLGAIINRSYYDHAFPYRYLPIEISLVGRAGITKDPSFQQNFEGGKIYFLNDSFYKEDPLFWLRGESKLEFLLQLKNKNSLTVDLQNGVIENRITLRIGSAKQEIKLGTVQNQTVDLSTYFREAKSYEGAYYLHGEMKSDSGYVPGLLSRDNPDYRFLSCRVVFHGK
jgi:hypothetical protein